MWRNRRRDGEGARRREARGAAAVFPGDVILRPLRGPKDLPYAARSVVDHGRSNAEQILRGDHAAGVVETRVVPEQRTTVRQILRGVNAPQDDTAREVFSHLVGTSPSRPLAASPLGFTLIEMLVVIAVIAILAGLVAPQVFSNVGDARTTSARAQIENLGLALDGYRLDNHQYPGTAQGLAALMVRPEGEPVPANWRGPYLRRALPNDPWDRPYIYRAPGDSVPNGYDLLSYGRDGKVGGVGEDQDITSWGATTR